MLNGGRVVNRNHSIKLRIKSIILFICFIACVAVMVGCPSDKIKKPPLKEPVISHKQETSVIQMPINMKSKDLKRMILNELENPVSSGKTDKITANILATESITERELIKELVSPFKPGHYVTKYKQVEKRVKKSYKCLIKPWKWGDCWKDIIAIVSVPTQIWIEPVEAVYKYVSKDVTKLIDKTYKTGVWVGHKVYLKDLDINFNGPEVIVFSRFNVDLLIDYEQAVVPLGPKIKIKGLLNGNLKVDVNVTGDITINDNAELSIKIPEDGADIKFTNLSLPDAVGGIDIVDIIQSEIQKIKNKIGKLVNKQLKKQIEKQIAKKQDDLIFGDKIQQLLIDNSNPIALAEDLWLIPAPEKIYISQINGNGKGTNNRLTINIGAAAKPKLIASITKPTVTIPDLIPIVSDEIESKIYLYPQIDISYDFAEVEVESELKKLMDKDYSNLPYTIDNVVFYPSDKRLVIAVDLVKRKNNKRVVTFYLWGIPTLNNEIMEVRLEDFDYTLETKNYLIKIANWVLDDKIRNIIKDRTVFNYKKELNDLTKKIANFDVPSKIGNLSGKLNSINADDLFTSTRALTVYVLATGEAEFTFEIPEPSFMLDEQELAVVRIQEERNIIPDSSKVMGFMSKGEDLVMTSSGTVILNPFVNMGDTIYYESSKGELKTRIAGPKDVTIPGETILVEDESGNIQVMKIE